MNDVWNKWVKANYRTKPRLASVLKGAKVKHYYDKILVDITVFNKAQQEWIELHTVPEIKNEYSDYCGGRPVTVTIQIRECR